MESVRQDVPDYDVVPGTVYLVQGAHQDGFSSRDIILMPTPLYSSTLGAITNGDSVVYLNLVQIYHTGINKLNYAGAVMLLLLGVGNVFFVPLSSKIWMAVSKQYGEYWGVNILRGLGSAPFEALPAISISDIYFAHERGGKLGAYVFGLAFGSFVGPVCGGYMVTGQGVRWMYWWGVIIVGALLVLFFFTLEETHFIRPLDMHDEALVSTMDMPELDKTLTTKST
ncbi:MFS general substrate transporter [Aureobasidium pullulans]|nr:MFS general substrate transporter [Aureobasidium pullulans]